MPLKLNAEKEGKDVAAKYKVTGYPTILFVDSTGKVVHTIVGYMPPADFAAQMELAKLAGNLPALEKQAKAHPEDAKNLSNLIAIYGAQKREPEMLRALEQFRKATSTKTSGLEAKTLSSVGDYYQNAEKPKEAIPYFQQAADAAKDPHDLAYALISLAVCDMAIKDNKAAVPVLERLLTLGDAAKDYEATAKAMLEQAKKG